MGIILVAMGSAACAAPSAPSAPGTRPGSGAQVKPVLPGGGTKPSVSRPGSTAAGAFPGDVAAGAVRWGAAIGGNADPARHEDPAGVPMGLRRTYYGWSNRMSGVRTATADLAAGRLPWVSFKTPGWAAMASGAHDAEIDGLLRALDAAGGPVWLTVHHEPENDGGNPAEWRAMQVKVRERMNAVGTRNIAFAPVLMSWTFDPLSHRNPDDWYVPGIWDFAGLDHYSETVANTTVEIRMWNNARDYYTAKGLKVAVGEWGNRGTDAVAAAEMKAFYDMALASATSGKAQVIGLAYFDSDLNSPKGGWTLYGSPLEQFRSLMGAATSLSPNETAA